jgi:hypothetical protein
MVPDDGSKSHPKKSEDVGSKNPAHRNLSRETTTVLGKY